ncbi:uncharacterized protein LOC129223242 [Uloborus diversus]|uniref:uncharacterized protein LOC129223242 n=1 Tax=Uloborus diversus TaxID=327109 RepID=UPI0024096ED4|nr:uncharacterized protein LOC129223242 [Uloborus diversus]
MLHGEHLFKCCERHYQLYRFDARVLQLRAVEYNTNTLTTAVTTAVTTTTTTATTPHILRIAPAYPIIERPPPFDEDEFQDRLIIDTDALSDSFRQQDEEEEEERQSNVLIEFPPTSCPVQPPVMKMEQEENLSPPTPCPVQPPVMKMERQEEELSPPTPCPVPTPVMKMEREQDDEMEIDIAQIEIRCNREETETLPQIPVPREEEEPSTSGDMQESSSSSFPTTTMYEPISPPPLPASSFDTTTMYEPISSSSPPPLPAQSFPTTMYESISFSLSPLPTPSFDTTTMYEPISPPPAPSFDTTMYEPISPPPLPTPSYNTVNDGLGNVPEFQPATPIIDLSIFSEDWFNNDDNFDLNSDFGTI